MSDLLEDRDGAPYPEPVQELVERIEVALSADLGEVEVHAEHEAMKDLVVEAIESVLDSLRESGRIAPEMLPAESMALTTALAQVLRGDEPTPNVATVCILALARLAGRYDWTEGRR